MSVVASVITLNQLQADGSRIVHEQHTDNLGIIHELRYLPGAGVDVNAVLAAHAAMVAQSLVETEINDLLTT